MPSYQAKQGSASYPLVFLLVSSTDHITGATGLTPTVTISKAGGAFAAPAGPVTEVGNGVYKVAGNATDTATLGPLALHATATGADPCDALYEVVAFDPQASLNLGLSALPAAAPGAAGGLLAFGTGTGQVNPSSGKVPATLAGTDVSGNVSASVAAITVANPPAGWINAAAIASSALNGKGDWLPSSSYTTPPTATTVATACATAILATPANKLTTTAAGAVPIDLNQAVPAANTAQTVGDSLNAARAQGFGKWTLIGTTLTIYAADGTTVVRSFTLDSAAAPTQRY
jgi:hypothetical protein